jgi:hypothetical protein
MMYLYGAGGACKNDSENFQYDRRGGYLKMYRINRPISGSRRSARMAVKFAAIAIICGAVAILGNRAWSAPAGAADGHREFNRQITRFAVASQSRIAQTEPDDDDKEVPPAQVDKYVNVYQAMQKDHSLTVEQAASKQGMTVAQFRSLEGKIERDDTLRERVRTALRKAANPGATDSDQ